MGCTSHRLTGPLRRAVALRESSQITDKALTESEVARYAHAMEPAALSALKAQFKTLGFQKRATGRVVFELLIHVSLTLGGAALFVYAHSFWLCLLGMAISTYGSVGVGTNTHTATHYAASRHRWVNEALTYFGYPFFLQLGATFWRHRHIVLHHPNPNVVGIDLDANFSPFFASTDREIQAKTGWFQQHTRYQWIAFPLIVWVHGYIRQIKSWTHVLRVLRDPKRRTSAHYFDVLAMLLHWVAWFVVPSFFFSVTDVIGFNLLRIGCIGYPLYCVLAPGHYPVEAHCVEAGNHTSDYVMLQTAGTINFRTGFLGSLVCSGLQYQIEHHLFPGYSHNHYPAMSKYVQRFCEQEGYPYRMLGWGEAVWATFKIFKQPKIVAADIDEIKQRVREDGTVLHPSPAG